MKIILATFGSFGDVQPFLFMGKILQAQGHQVLFIANPRFADPVLAAGLEFQPAGTLEEYEQAARPAAKTGSRFRDQGEQIAASRRLFNLMFLKPARETCRIIAGNRTPDTLIIGHFYAYGARLAAEKYRLRYLNICLSPYWLKGFIKPMNLPAAFQKFASNASTRFIDGQLFTKPFNVLRAEIGLGPMGKSSSRWMFEGDNLCLFPEWLPDFPLEDGFQADFAGFPMDCADIGELPERLADFLRRYGKPVVFTPGSAVTDVSVFFREALKTLDHLGKPGIFLTRAPDGLRENPPENVMCLDFAPLGQLLPGCLAIVHHGGIGTAAQALASGIPQLICHRMDEQKENARVLERFGVSLSMPYAHLDKGEMAAIVATLVTDEAIQARCRDMMYKPMQMPEDFIGKYIL